jgi:hypothetical protein
MKMPKPKTAHRPKILPLEDRPGRQLCDCEGFDDNDEPVDAARSLVDFESVERNSGIRRETSRRYRYDWGRG